MAMSKEVEAALVLHEWSSNYKVRMSPRQAVQFAENCTTYNEITREGLINLIESVNALIPRVRGQYAHHFEIGNEGSLVVYVRVPYIEQGRHWDPLVIGNELERLGEEAKASSFHRIEDGPMVGIWRFWWD